MNSRNCTEDSLLAGLNRFIGNPYFANDSGIYTIDSIFDFFQERLDDWALQEVIVMMSGVCRRK